MLASRVLSLHGEPAVPYVEGHEAHCARTGMVRVHIETFTFTLENAVWDDEQQLLVITYTRDIEGRRDRACEIVRFNSAGEVVEGEGMYGAQLT